MKLKKIKPDHYKDSDLGRIALYKAVREGYLGVQIVRPPPRPPRPESAFSRDSPEDGRCIRD